jgi:N-acetylglucosamine transport system permease protein
MKRSPYDRINWKRELHFLPGYIVLIAWIAFAAAFLLWILAASLSTSREIFSGNVFAFKTGLHFENYAKAWRQQNVSRFFGNSLLYAVVTCVVVIFISAPAAYVLSRYKFFSNKMIRSSLIVAMSIPAVMIIMPLFSMTTRWGIKGRILLIALYIFSHVPYTTIYLLNFFATLSRTYEEAAAIDGCPPGKTFWIIMLPLVQPALVTVTIFNFLGCVERVLHGLDLRQYGEDDAGRRWIAADRQRDEVYRRLWWPVRCGDHRVPPDVRPVPVPLRADHPGGDRGWHQGITFRTSQSIRTKES